MNRLVLFAPNWLGDAVMALPAIADVRRALPDAFVAVAARPSIAPLFALVPGIDGVTALETPRGMRSVSAWREIGRELKDGGFDTAILFPNSYRAALVAARAGIPERWGYRTDWRGYLLTRPVAAPSGVHQVDYYRRLVEALGFPNGSADPVLRIDEAVRARSAALLTEAGWDGKAPLVALAPGAAYGGAKRWPPASFGELATALAGDGVTSVLVGSAADQATGAEVLAAAPATPVVNLIGRTDLAGLAGVFAHCRAVVSNDSGAMHVAAAVGVHVTALFGPTRENETAPRSANVELLIHPVWCRPCMLRECPIDHQCMRGIGVDRVFRSARPSR
jgi:lipopolysaccharide heptosyltransferase II